MVLDGSIPEPPVEYATTRVCNDYNQPKFDEEEAIVPAHVCNDVKLYQLNLFEIEKDNELPS